MQDNDRGTVAGRRSFGKGLVQEQFEHPDGSAFRITTQRYYTPTGRCIQKPYKKGDKDGYDNDWMIRLESGELTSKDSIHFIDSLMFVTPKGKSFMEVGVLCQMYLFHLTPTTITRVLLKLIAKI